ncbi:MAG: ABC transporter permease, partial [Bacillota bacterium]
MMGNVYGMENLTQASLMAQECLVWFLIASAVMNILLVNRHTRADEELGRLELFRAMPVGRITGSLAVLLFALVLNVLISVLTAVFLIALNIGGTTVAGAFTYGFAIGALGLVFAALTLLAAQLFSTAHGVSAFGFAMLILFYILRAGGDVSGGPLSVISPLGLGLKVEAFYVNKLWPLAILMAESAMLALIALAVNAVRDHGAGVIPVKSGRAHASRFLCSPLGLSWRLTRGTALGWGAGIFLLGASYGSVCTELDAFVSRNELMQRIIAQSGGNVLLDNYVAMIFMIMSLVASVPVVLTVLKIHGEEKSGRLEQLFARSVPRARLYSGFLAAAFIESAAMELLLAAGLSATAGGALAFGEMLKAGLCYLPAIWAMVGLAVLLVGILPRLTALVWAVFGYTFLVMYFGRIVDVPEWARRITPFGNIPQLPVQEFSALPLAMLTFAAAVLAALGVWRYKARDIG